MRSDLERFQNLTFDDFRRLAKDPSASPYEKVGFPNAYREGKEDFIFADIRRKLPNLDKRNQVVMEIGPGCGGLVSRMIALCHRQGHSLILVDSQEVLDQLPDEPFITKIPGYFPTQCSVAVERYARKVDVILAYSVIHYVFREGNIFAFLDASLGLLANGGSMLIGDIPNVSKRKRFFSSPAGVKFHQQFMGTTEAPTVTFNTLDEGQIDDAVLCALILRCRSAGFDAYWLPQPNELPMANRREDLLVIRP